MTDENWSSFVVPWKGFSLFLILTIVDIRLYQKKNCWSLEIRFCGIQLYPFGNPRYVKMSSYDARLQFQYVKIWCLVVIWTNVVNGLTSSGFTLVLLIFIKAFNQWENFSGSLENKLGHAKRQLRPLAVVNPSPPRHPLPRPPRHPLPPSLVIPSSYQSPRSKSRVFAHSEKRVTDGPTDGRMDRPSYRDARTHLKKDKSLWSFPWCFDPLHLSLLNSELSTLLA